MTLRLPNARRTAVSVLALSFALAVGACAATTSRPIPINYVKPADSIVTDAARAHPDLWPHAASPAAMTDPATEAFVTELMAKMTLEEKVGQTIQADIASIKPEDLLTYPLGSILAGGNSSPGGDERASAQKWVELAQAFRRAVAQRPGAKIPMIYGIDAVHGHNNIVGATIFPHNS
ncbi:MAG: glycoside hydrolase family 3 N-terminal domain-containing protein, partial [Brevundimonas sp.]